MLDAAYATEAATQFNETPAQGPYTLAMSNSAIWISLPNVTVNYAPILDQIRSLASTSSNPKCKPKSTSPKASPDPSPNPDRITTLHLPPSYALESPSSQAALVAGYRSQLLALVDLLANPRAPSLESAFATGTSVAAVLLHPLSRGTVRLNLTHPFEPPILDYRSASNPIDMALHVAHSKYMRRMVRTKVLRGLGAVEVSPGEEVNDEDEAGMVRFVREKTVQSYMHPCCTAAMMPKAKGGVVGKDLRVHGAQGLRVVDASVFPVLPGSHLSATAYAVAEKVSSPPFACLLFLLSPAPIRG